MAYSIENVNGCTKKIVFNFDSVDLSSQINTELKKKQKSVALKGFRKGKAPLALVEKMYKAQVEGDALNSFVQKEFFETIQKEELQVVGYPKFENMNFDGGKTMSFDAVVEVFPTVELKDMKGLSFDKEDTKVKKEDLEQFRESYYAQKAEMQVVTDKRVKLKAGLFAVMNFQGEMEDGSKPENMKGEEFMLEIGSGQFIPGFEDGMIGMKPGETKDIELSFPADYHVEELKDAKVVFHVELLEMKKKELPELNEELAKELGFESVEDFNEKTEKNLVLQKERAASDKLHKEILDKLIEENTFEVPAAMIAQQADYVRQDMANNLKMQGFTEDMVGEYFSKWASDINAKAEHQVKSGLILDAIAKEHNIEATEADFEAKLQETAEQSGLEVDKIKEFYGKDENVKNNMMYAVREEKTFAKIKEIVTIK